MGDPLIVVVLLAGQAGDPITDGILAATKQALGPYAVVLSEATTEPVGVSDVDALAIGERAHARAIARVTWADASHTVARLHVHVGAATSSWSDDEISFSSRDVSGEKARTVGYTLATMVQRIEQQAQAAELQEKQQLDRKREQAREQDQREQLERQRMVAEAARTSRDSAPATPHVVGQDGLEIQASAIGALADAATSLGGDARARWWLRGARLGVHAVAGARFGRVREADTSSMTAFGGVGPSVRFLTLSRFELSARADVMLMRHAMTRAATATTAELSHDRWLGALDLALEASWSFSEQLGVMVASGAEVAFGTTTVSVGGSRVADIPPIRAIAEIGGRIRF